ncbi:MAG: hypothetical protein FJ010_02815 [Chloroflexi bacterium]|nr:hypothetical protein [Chloroflexota bacterium]
MATVERTALHKFDWSSLRTQWILALLLTFLVMSGIWASVFAQGIRPSQGIEFIPISMRANAQADYSSDPNLSFRPVSLQIVEDVLQDESPSDGSINDRIANLEAQLMTPIPTVTPMPTATPASGVGVTPRPTATPETRKGSGGAASPTSDSQARTSTPETMNTPFPSRTSVPAETSEPTTTSKPANTPHPSHTPKPQNNPNPTHTPKPQNTPHPTNEPGSNKPDEPPGQSDDPPGNSDDSPGNSGDAPGQQDKPTKGPKPIKDK